MNRIYVSPYKLRSGKWSARRILWATFHSSLDMHHFADKLRTENPSWVIDCYESGRTRKAVRS